MTDGTRRGRKMRPYNDDQHGEVSAHPISQDKNQEASTAKDSERVQRLNDMQTESLGFQRRHDISTSDHPENRVVVDMDLIQRKRRINQSGTMENKVSPATVQILSSWNNAYSVLKNDGAADEGLQDLAAGQTHRTKLMTDLSQDHGGIPGRGRSPACGGPGRRGGPPSRGGTATLGGSATRGGPINRGGLRNRGGGRSAGGRGGGIVGSRGRELPQLRTSIEPLMDKDLSARRPIVRPILMAPDLRNPSPDMGLNVVKDDSSQKHPRSEVRNVGQQPRTARYEESLLAAPDTFMASFRSSALAKPTLASAAMPANQSEIAESPAITSEIIDLLSGPAEDDTTAPAPAHIIGAQQLSSENSPTEALLDLTEDDVPNISASSTNIQADEILYGDDLQGLEMTEPILQAERDPMRPSSMQLSPDTIPLEAFSEEPHQKHIPPQATEGTSQKRITDYFIMAKDVKEIALTMADSTAGRVQSRQDEFAQAVLNGSDPTKFLVGTSLIESRWAPRKRSGPTLLLPAHRTHDPPLDHEAVARTEYQAQFDHISRRYFTRESTTRRVQAGPPSLTNSCVVSQSSQSADSPSPTIDHVTHQSLSRQKVRLPRPIAGPGYSSVAARSTHGAGPGPALTATLPIHLAGSIHSGDPGAAARLQYGRTRGSALVPNITRQLTAIPAADAGLGRGAAVRPPTDAFSGTIKPRPGPSMLNRGGLFQNDGDDDEEPKNL